MVVTPKMKEWVENLCGNNWYTKRGSSFLVGVVGAAMGHPFDTALTRAQAGKTITLAVLPLGLASRSATIGFLSLEIDVFSELLDSLDKKLIASPEGKAPQSQS